MKSHIKLNLSFFSFALSSVVGRGSTISSRSTSCLLTFADSLTACPNTRPLFVKARRWSRPVLICATFSLRPSPSFVSVM